MPYWLNSFKKPSIIILLLAVSFSGCAGGGAVSKNGAPGLLARNIPEGILLTLSRNHAETTGVFIRFMEEFDEGEYPVPVFAGVRGPRPERLKAAGAIVCPFTRGGRDTRA